MAKNTKKERKPHGFGQAALQRKERNKNATVVAAQLRDHSNLERVEATGVVFPLGSLKKREVRAAILPWVYDWRRSRLFTHRFCTTVIRKFVALLGVIPPRDPKETFSQWVSAQARRLQLLVRQAKKARHSMSSRDPSTWETQPVEWPQAGSELATLKLVLRFQWQEFFLFTSYFFQEGFRFVTTRH